VCGGEFVDSGMITSPNYPAEYPPGKKCSWKITVKEEFIVVLRFKYFKVQKHRNCTYDYVAVYDGPTEASPLLGKHCGNRKPKPIKSSGNTMYVKFVSDESRQKVGFSASFVPASCGGEFVGSGVIASPDFPAEYLPGKNCSWKITVKEGFIVVLEFRFFQ
ncbi:unnamed protein product, partial [Candidula unifasciata]